MPTRNLLIATAAAVLSLAAPAAAAPVELGGEATTLRLDASTAKTLKSLGVSVAPISGARSSSAGIAFPVTTGRIETFNLHGTIRHSGGLRLRAGGTSLRLTSFNVRIDSRQATLSALAGGSRAAIITLDASDAEIAQDGAELTASGIVARLSRTGAAALNATFGVKAFKRGLRLGTVTTTLRPETVVTLSGGQTDLALDGATAQALQANGISAAPVAPATASGTTFSFPIRAGSEAAAGLQLAEIGHTGGISLSKGSTTIPLTDFDVVLNAAPALFASVGGAAEKVRIVDLDLSRLQGPTVENGGVTVGQVHVRLSPTGAGALNAAFGTNLPAGTLLGIATVRGRL